MELENFGLVYKDYDLCNNNTYRLHSNCDYFMIVNDVVKLINLINYLNKNNIKYFIIGNGSNIILPDEYKGVVIKLDFNKIEYNGHKVIVGSSYMLNKLALDCINNGLIGLEWAAGIPGTIGAAVIGNAGAYNDEIGAYLEEIEVLENNKVKIIKKNDIFFEYRNTSLKKRNLVILKVALNLRKGDKEEALCLVKDRAERRRKSQPLDYPNAGSVFRNPNGYFAGKLIEDLGLKGKKINDAEVSEKHANFIINKGSASSKDIRDLIKLIHTEVFNKYGIDLYLEQEIID